MSYKMKATREQVERFATAMFATGIGMILVAIWMLLGAAAAISASGALLVAMALYVETRIDEWFYEGGDADERE